MIQRNCLLKISGFCVKAITLWISVLLLNGCKNEQAAERSVLPAGQQLLFLDSALAAAAILDDDMEHFFTQVTRLDMILQMQQNYAGDVSRDSVLRDYRHFLERDVMDFYENEKLVLTNVMASIQELCMQIAPDIFPRKIELIKTRGRHYGNSVYYTRENRIIIPANELVSPDTAALREVLTHEVFHIYSRLHPGKREALYALIGFRELKDVLILPNAVKSRLLLNPDGVDFGYAMRLAIANGDTIQVVPIITANAPAYLPGRESYFEYIDFNLYPIVQQTNGFQVVINNLGLSPIAVNEQPDFFRQIGDNTLYIIHPDEILADNFKFLVLAQTGEQSYRLRRFSQEGQQLLREVRKILQHGK